MAENRAFSGARARIYFDGTKIAGWATGVRGMERYNNVRVDVMDNIDSEDIEPTGRTVTFSADFVRILRRSLRKMGIWPPNTTVADATKTVVEWPKMTVDVFDGVNKLPVYRILGARPSSRNFSGDKSGLFTEQCEWEAIRLLDLSDE